MKLHALKTGLFLLISALILPFWVSAQGYERIVSFDTAIQLQKDGRIQVAETIRYDFGTEQRHGIFRTIPYVITNPDGKRYQMDFDVQSVTNEQGTPYRYQESDENLALELKIGDPDKTITGINTYVITYSVAGAMRYFSDHDELYWNVTGNEWNVPMDAASVSVQPQFQVSADQVKAVCYTGVQGSTDTSCTTGTENGGLQAVTTRPQGAGEGLTVSYWIPKGLVAVLEPKEYVDFWETTIGRVVAASLLLAVLWWYIGYPVWLMIKWFLFGRDPYVGPDVTALFEAPTTRKGRSLTPAETGTMIDEKVEMKDIAAMMINLAQRGYYKIKETQPKEFTFIRDKEPDDELLPFERFFLQSLFHDKSEVQLKDAKMVAAVESIKDQMLTNLTKEGFFPSNPKGIQTFYGVMMGLAGTTLNLPLLISGALFGMNMVRKTVDGAKAASKARSLRNFLRSQERQMQYQGDKQLLFEKLLPFAIAFGVEQQWSERFKDIELHEPEWFSGYYDSGFNAHVFSNSLRSSVNTFATAATPVVSSTGSSSGFSSGGFSGGGGGGGGGGSW